ncbi:MAG: hypothetical protein TREMPRED_002509 [Tremellales sp. Tagirdzhanova-0007]|nr:MAG: hypothetical protein TREMPRED_002509 [Tremellales sp. Tagirdzhanova-0007]
MWLTIQLVISVALPRPTNPNTAETRTVRHSRVLLVSPEEKSLPTLDSLLPPSLSTETVIFALPFHHAHTQPPPTKPPGRAFFPPLAPTIPLEYALKGTAWVEFPIIHVIPRAEWDEAMQKGELTVMSLYEPMLEEPNGRTRDNGWGPKRQTPRGESGPALEPVTKKVKIAPDLGLAALGEYESADDDGSEDGKKSENGEKSRGEKEAPVKGENGVVDGQVDLVHSESKAEDGDFELDDDDDVDLNTEEIGLGDPSGMEDGLIELEDGEDEEEDDNVDGLELGEDDLDEA